MMSDGLRVIFVPVLAFAGSCVPIDCPTCVTPQKVQVAHVSAIYGNTAAAFVGTTPAHVNEPIYEGDHFYTRAGAKMEVALEMGGSIALDENTDPSLFKEAQCFMIRLFSGRMTVTNDIPVCVESGQNAAGQHSYVMYEAAPSSGTLSITVIWGQVTTIRPPGFTINTGQMIVLRNGRVASPPRQLNPAILSRMQSWIPRTIL